MSILEKFFKNKKGLCKEEIHKPELKPRKYGKSTEIHHAKAVLEDEKLYNTETAERVFCGDAENITFGESVCRAYFITPHERWFSAEEDTNIYKTFVAYDEYEQEDTVIKITYGKLKIENVLAIKHLLGKFDAGLYEKYFGEAEEG